MFRLCNVIKNVKDYLNNFHVYLQTNTQVLLMHTNDRHVLNLLDLLFNFCKTVSNNYLFYSNSYAGLQRINCLVSEACLNLSGIHILYNMNF